MLLSSSKRARELDERGDLLAVARGLLQGFDDRRIAAGAVERQLDSHHVLIFGCLTDEIDHRHEGFIRVVKDDVLFADPFVKFGRFGALRGNHGREARIKQFRAPDHVDETAKRSMLTGPGIRKALSEVRFIDESSRCIIAFRDVGLDFEPDRRSLAQVADLLLDGFEQVARFFLRRRKGRCCA
jgi:hypothetical protein